MTTNTFIGLLAVAAIALLAGIYIGAEKHTAVTDFTTGIYNINKIAEDDHMEAGDDAMMMMEEEGDAMENDDAMMMEEGAEADPTPAV